MAFRLQQQESVADGLRRLARKELRAARDGLLRSVPPSDEAVHEARKSVKKARAVVRLIEQGGGRRLAGAGKTLRAVNRTLSRVRDAEAMSETLAMLREKSPRVLSEHTFARMQRQLKAHKRDVVQAAVDQEAWIDTSPMLRDVRKRAARWRLPHRGFGLLAPGLKRAHHQGCAAMARAERLQRAADFHEWRKKVKSLWYGLRLLEACDAAIRRDVRALHSAETSLGDEHNIVVLCAQVSGDPAIARNAADVARLRRAADGHQRRLRGKAIAAARHIYAMSPEDYLDRIRRAWKTWRRRQTSPARRRAS